MQENMTTQPLDLAHEKSPNVPNKTTNSSNLVKKPKMSAVPDLDRNLGYKILQLIAKYRAEY